MIEEILPRIFRIEVPLPQNPLRAVNAYVIRDGAATLLIDTGMNRPECREALLSGLRELGVDLGGTDFFITHLHADHIGLAAPLVRPGRKVYFNAADAAIVGQPFYWERCACWARRNGFPADLVERAITTHPGVKYGPAPGDITFTLMGAGDYLDAGGYHLECLITPGHSWGHACLYDAEKKLLFAGDHLLEDITPNISLWANDEDPLGDYLKSLDRTGVLEVSLVLPGHRRFFTDHRRRIAELKEHHRVRTEEVLSILARGPQDAYRVASQMTWDMTYRSFNDFPVQQKWFAAGEAMAHIRYLEVRGRVHALAQGDNISFAQDGAS
jgi:glyoxylase-like metal-dependent hydrolase (beta-lactamase superfamily II)